jgi:Ca2+-binding RTX toxin-like protein
MLQELDKNREVKDESNDPQDIQDGNDPQDMQDIEDNNQIGGTENDPDFQTVDIKDLHSDVIQAASGTIKEINQDGFILEDSTGEILVDVPEISKIAPGDQVTVIGEYSNLGGVIEFGGLNITKADGSVVLNPLETEGAGSEDDILDGNTEANTLDGDLGNDFIQGRGGNDTILGGDGDDLLLGGEGADSLTGGTGIDQFLYDSVVKDGGDFITDFNVQEDIINVGEIFESPTNYNSQNPFADYVQLTQLGSSTQIGFDPDGDTGTDPFQVLATLQDTNANTLSQDNFDFIG